MKRIITTLVVAGALLLSTNHSNAQCYSAVSLDGVNDYLYTPFSNYTFNNFTMEMWINSADYNPNEHYISLYQNAYIVLGGWGSGGVFNTWADGLSPIAIASSSANTPATGTWHHVAFVYDGTNQILYIDGVAVTTTATTGSVNPSGFTQGLVIGARYDQNQQYTNTMFEDIRIWTVARTSAELNANMNINLTGSETGLVAYYRFEDGQGSNTVSDLTGNGNTLTMYNMDPMTDWVTGPLGGAVQSTDVQNTCGPITWIDGNTYSSDTLGATFMYPGGSVNGCDSIVTLDLTVNSASQATDVQVACDSYMWIDSNVYTVSTNTATFTYVGGAANGCDSIVTLDLTINASQQSTDVQTACDSYTWIDGNIYTASTNTATYSVPGGAVNGCDSVVTLNLTINSVDNTVSTNEFELTANEAGAQYQWVDCDNNYAAISGETNQLFTATANGNYAVIVTGANGCSDTSACVAITTISVEEVSLENGIVVSPNPTSGKFAISTHNYSGEVKIEVMDITGKLILKTTAELNPTTEKHIDLSHLANGVYIVNVSDSIQSHATRVVKR